MKSYSPEKSKAPQPSDQMNFVKFELVPIDYPSALVIKQYDEKSNYEQKPNYDQKPNYGQNQGNQGPVSNQYKMMYHNQMPNYKQPKQEMPYQNQNQYKPSGQPSGGQSGYPNAQNAGGYTSGQSYPQQGGGHNSGGQQQNYKDKPQGPYKNEIRPQPYQDKNAKPQGPYQGPQGQYQGQQKSYQPQNQQNKGGNTKAMNYWMNPDPKANQNVKYNEPKYQKPMVYPVPAKQIQMKDPFYIPPDATTPIRFHFMRQNLYKLPQDYVPLLRNPFKKYKPLYKPPRGKPPLKSPNKEMDNEYEMYKPSKNYLKPIKFWDEKVLSQPSSILPAKYLQNYEYDLEDHKYYESQIKLPKVHKTKPKRKKHYLTDLPYNLAESLTHITSYKDIFKFGFPSFSRRSKKSWGQPWGHPYHGHPLEYNLKFQYNNGYYGHHYDNGDHCLSDEEHPSSEHYHSKSYHSSKDLIHSGSSLINKLTGSTNNHHYKPYHKPNHKEILLI